MSATTVELTRAAFHCPDWCVDPLEAHADPDTMRAMRGDVLHSGAEITLPGIGTVHRAVLTDRRGNQDGPVTVHLDNCEQVSAAQMRQSALALLEMAELIDPSDD